MVIPVVAVVVYVVVALIVAGCVLGLADLLQARIESLKDKPNLSWALALLAGFLLAILLFNVVDWGLSRLPAIPGPVITVALEPIPPAEVDYDAIVAAVVQALPTPQVIEKEVVVEKEVVKEVPVEVIVTPTPAPAPPVSASMSAAWPASPAEAAATFGGSANRWEPSAEGGWHLREEAFTTVINPRGYLAEGYFDTKPGRNAQCFVFVVPMGVQGATIWPESGTLDNARNLQAKMAIPVWDDGTTHLCQIMGP